jgi:hypothetical protein
MVIVRSKDMFKEQEVSLCLVLMDLLEFDISEDACIFRYKTIIFRISNK